MKKNRLFYSLVFLLVFLFSCKHNLKETNRGKQGEDEQLVDVSLTSFKVEGSEQEIKENMDLGFTIGTKMKIEYKTQPSDADIIFTPALDDQGYWLLGDDYGKKTLNILVKKGSNQKNYTATIERKSEDSLHLKKITVGSEAKEGSNILSNMIFSDVKKGFIAVEVEPSDSEAQVAFQDEASSSNKTYKWVLSQGKNALKIKLIKGDEQVTYIANITSKAKALYVSYHLNGKSMVNLEDSFNEKLEKGENPLFTSKTPFLNIYLRVVGTPQSIKINGENISFTPNPVTTEAYYSLPLNEEEKQLEITVFPDDATAEITPIRMLQFRAIGGNAKEKIEPKLEISEDAFLPKETFLDKLSDGSSPLYKVFKSPALLRITLSDYEKSFLCEQIKINDEAQSFIKYKVEKDIALEENSEKTIKVEFVSKNKDIMDDLVWTFRLATGGEKPKLRDTSLYSINDVGTHKSDLLPESLTEHLIDGSKPVYIFDGKSPKVVVGSSKDVIKEIIFKMDGVQKAKLPTKKDGSRYIAAHYFDIEDEAVHEIEITMTPKDGENYSPITYSFKLKSSGLKPKLPKSKFYFYKINGESSVRLPKLFTQHTTDGTNPSHTIKGKQAIIEMENLDKDSFDLSEKVIFTCGNEPSVEVSFARMKLQLGTILVAKHQFILPDSTNEHLIKVEIVPKDSENYRSLIFSFKLKSDGSLVKMPLLVGFNGEVKKDGDRATIAQEIVNLLVQTDYDIIKEVKIGEKGKDEAVCDVKKLQGAKGVFYQAIRTVSLIENNETPEKTIVVKVLPKDEGTFLGATYTFYITGTKIPENNAKFIYEKDKPKISTSVKFKAGCASKHGDDYGSTSASFIAYTVSTRAKVFYIFTDVDGKPLPNTQAVELTNSGDGSHKSEQIQLFEDKPTFIALFVVAEDGNTTDKEEGTWLAKLNPVFLAWDYEKRDNFADYKNEAYDVITLDKTKVQDNKIFVSFMVWKESYGFTVDSSSLPQYQGAFEKQNATKIMQSYTTEVNVEKLIDGSEQSLEIKLPIKKGTIDCLTYKVKIN